MCYKEIMYLYIIANRKITYIISKYYNFKLNFNFYIKQYKRINDIFVEIN